MSYSYIVTETIARTVDKKFIGTLFDGAILAFFGFRFYTKQKQIDIKFEDLRKLKDKAAALFAAINSASNKIGGLFNMYDQENPTLHRRDESGHRLNRRTQPVDHVSLAARRQEVPAVESGSRSHGGVVDCDPNGHGL